MKRLFALLLTLLLATPTWAANEITVDDPALTGQTLYVVVKSGTTALTTGTTLAAYSTTRSDFDQALTESGTTGLFTYSLPALTAATYNWTVYQDANDDATPSHTEDIAISEGSGYWTGTKFGIADIGVAGAGLTSVPSSVPEVLQSTTIATLASQTSFTLTAGSTDNDAYNDAYAIITDASTSTQKAFAPIADYVGSTRTVTLEYDPAIFTMSATDNIAIVAATVQRVAPFIILPDHTWKFDRPSQVTAPNMLNENASGNILVQMDFTTALAGDSIDAISSVSVTDAAGETEPTIVRTAVSVDKKKVIITTNTASATEYNVGYLYTVTVTSVDGQTITRKGRLVIQ